MAAQKTVIEVHTPVKWRTGMPWPGYVVLAADRRRSAPLETATPDADRFLGDGRMGVESSGKIMVQPCFQVYGA